METYLFLERPPKHSAGMKPRYTLMETPVEYDGETLPSFYQEVMKCADSYEVCTKLIGSKLVWDNLLKNSWFTKGHKSISYFRGYNAWLEDMKERDTSLAKRVLLKAANRGDVAAAKKLVDMFKPKEVTARGRPSKEEVHKEVVKKADDLLAIKEDLQRMNIIQFRSNQ